MPVHNNLGIRMKEFYEQVPKTRLVRRMPVAIRLDGKAFHTFTRRFQKPFDKLLMESMQKTMMYLCENIQGCVFGYTQSDEITLILIDYQKLDTSAWFDYEVQKMCSVSASMATMAFNKFFAAAVWQWGRDNVPFFHDGGYDINDMTDEERLIIERYNIYTKAVDTGAMFDARVFNIPKEEVTNLVYWRQLDAARNSVQMVGQANFSYNELQGKSCNNIQDMLMTEKGINWNDLPTYQKRGSACIKTRGERVVAYDAHNRPAATFDVGASWTVDLDMPMLKGEDRNYLEQFILVGEQ